MKKFTKISLITFFSLSGAIILGTVCWHFYDPDPSKVTASTVEGKCVYNVLDPRETVGASDYVFIGKVEKREGYVYEGDMPYTVYSVTVDRNLKGELPTDAPVTLQKMGGLEKSKLSTVIVGEDDFFPTEGETYLFAACVTQDGVLVTPSSNRVIPMTGDSVIETYTDAIENEVQNDSVQRLWETRNHVYGQITAT